MSILITGHPLVMTTSSRDHHWACYFCQVAFSIASSSAVSWLLDPLDVPWKVSFQLCLLIFCERCRPAAGSSGVWKLSWARSSREGALATRPSTPVLTSTGTDKIYEDSHTSCQRSSPTCPRTQPDTNALQRDSCCHHIAQHTNSSSRHSEPSRESSDDAYDVRLCPAWCNGFSSNVSESEFRRLKLNYKRAHLHVGSQWQGFTCTILLLKETSFPDWKGCLSSFESQPTPVRCSYHIVHRSAGYHNQSEANVLKCSVECRRVNARDTHACLSSKLLMRPGGLTRHSLGGV